MRCSKSKKRKKLWIRGYLNGPVLQRKLFHIVLITEKKILERVLQKLLRAEFTEN